MTGRRPARTGPAALRRRVPAAVLALVTALLFGPARLPGPAQLFGPAPAAAQGVRGELRMTASFVDYRTVVRDSIPESEVPGDGTTRELPDGTRVVCVPGGYCYWYRAGEVVSANPVTQDLSLTAWPGWRGVSARGRLRGRFGSDDLWPRDEQEVALIDLSVDLERPAFRARGGRIERPGGLGTYYFDGGSFLWRGVPILRLEAFAGRSLGRGLLQPYTGSLLAEADELPPDTGAVLIGFEGKVRPSARLSAGLLYQRELRTDRVGLYSERIALDARWTPGRASVDLSGDLDMATGNFNEFKLRLGTPLTRTIDLSVEARHYLPFFELWTIWGAFSPVGYDEGRLQAWWRPAPGWTVQAGGAYRDYGDPHTGTALAPVEGDGARYFGGATWTTGPWEASANGRIDRGYGAYRGQLDLSFLRRLGARTQFGLYGLGTEQFTEFRFGEGTSRGLGLTARHGAGRFDLDGRIALYHHSFDNRPGYADYDQWRGSLGLVYAFGADAAPMPRPGGGPARS